MRGVRGADRKNIPVDEMLALVRGGLTLRQLAAHFKVNTKTMSEHLRREGLRDQVVRAKPAPAPDREQIVQLLLGGMSADAIVQQIGGRTHMVYRIAKEYGLVKAYKIHDNYGGILGSFWGRMVTAWKRDKENIDEAITIKQAWELFQQQDGKCFFSGVPLLLPKRHYDFKSRGNYDASLDRINPRLGHIHGNVRWTRVDINLMRGTLSEEEFIVHCNNVARTHPREAS